MGELRDQLTVLTAICMRVEGAVNALTTEARAGRAAAHDRHRKILAINGWRCRKRIEAGSLPGSTGRGDQQ
jgi:hypothetical protein